MSADTGADVEAMCRKCGDVWHVVVAKVDGQIVKVLCKECGGQHRYRTSADKRAKATGTRKTAAKKKAAAPAPRIDKPTVAPNLKKPVRTYSIRDTYEPGERIEHPKFGTGVVEVSNAPGKMDVFFPEGRRVLAQAKPQTTLQRPPRFVHD
jgi:predicted  nucleic acid-binding Zn-ribbon protein